MAGFDPTLGGSAANSYQSLEDANTFFAYSPYQTQWDAFDDAQKHTALIQATFWLETLDWAGDRCTPSTDDAALPQALAWPRSGASCDGIEATCAFIPKEVKQAQCLLAMNFAAAPDAIIGAPGGGNTTPPGLYVSRNQLGELVQEFSEYSSANSSCNDCSTPEIVEKFPWLTDLLGCWADLSIGQQARVLLRVRS